ncbi:Crp/Fnr family transcriptional regulator [Paracrocinitomix mangrovi]|uniref:Crp/Fnr family transcriptional regulator n=1 Tax=Paracrocinitomix mangrovi TaxID=2862509 RepID=UPI001EDC0425|nr:Crp/Fnr family transcriptional regulator [Paracrocinitomix mangrovi]UKN03733.1 Crp/Fnr family transcriptional regulator [Paracrocinitomix mangrovi]
MTERKPELEQFIKMNFGAHDEDLQKISSYFTILPLKKGAHFLKKGQYSDKLGFVKSGVLREYVEVDDKEVTKWISTEGYFVTDIIGFFFDETARYNIHAIEDSELYVVDRNTYRQIGNDIQRWKELEKLFIAKCFAVLEQRVMNHLSLSAEERYLALFEINKSLFNTVPLQYIASMLGMTPETFSRIRNKLADSTS